MYNTVLTFLCNVRLNLFQQLATNIAILWLLFPQSVSAQATTAHRPLIFIPGILGTQLLDQDNKVIWGDVNSLHNFAKLEMTDMGPVSNLHPGRLIESVNVLGPFWSIHQYDSLLDTLDGLGYKEGTNLFILYYDWRYSNFASANALKKLADSPDLKGKKFDILAHSMGGIIARIYINDLGGATRVSRLISLGVPSQGSMNALAEMAEGWGGFENFIAGGIDTIRRVMFSFPALYELFPSYEGCCRIGNEKQYTLFDPTDFNLWIKENWLPPEHMNESRLAKIKIALNDARRVRAVLKSPLPDKIEHTLIAGDRFSTNYYLYVDPNNRSWEKWRFSKSRGDGTVPLWSAANSNDPSASLPAFVDHATIFSDKWVVNKLQRMLDKNGGPPPVASTSEPLARTKDDKLIEVSLVTVVLDNTVVTPGTQVKLGLTIASSSVVKRGNLVPVISVAGPGSEASVHYEDETTDDDINRRTLRFTALVTTAAPGAYSVSIMLPGMGVYTRDIIALPTSPEESDK